MIPKKIPAGGLSIAAITAAYKISDGTAKSLLHLAKHHPGKLLAAGTSWLLIISLILSFPLVKPFWKWVSGKILKKNQPDRGNFKSLQKWQKILVAPCKMERFRWLLFLLR